MRDFIKKHEGFRENIYEDKKKHKTIGYGFNLDDPAVRSLIPVDVRLGKRPIKREESEVILDKLIIRAQKDAESVVGSKVWSNLSGKQRMVLTDMSYNLGKTKLNGFHEMKKALRKSDYRKAAYEMRNSEWYGQVKSRGVEDVNTFLGNSENTMSFSEAFKKARENGLKVFEWGNKKYSTKLRGEK